jgi:hypothetical protein
MVQFIEVVPALFDRREAWAWLGDGRGGYEATPLTLPLPASVLSLEAGPPALPALALTDSGVSVLRAFRAEGRARLVLEPLVSDRPALAGTGTFVPELGMVRDLDGDGDLDLLLPASDGAAVHLFDDGTLRADATQRVKLPGDRSVAGLRPARAVPLADVRDLDADGEPDLVVNGSEWGSDRFLLLRGEGSGRFAAPRPLSTRCLFPQSPPGPKAPAVPPPERDRKKKKKKTSEEREALEAHGELTYVGDLDGDGAVEAVLETSLDKDDGLKEAKEPHSRLAFHRAISGLEFAPEPYATLDMVGYAFGGSFPMFSDEGFRDLDGDGRLDLVAITLDFSLLQVVKVLATKKVSIGVDFHVWWQAEDGTFRPVQGLDLSETIRLDLNDLKLSRLAEFGGDFDGDGKIDFLHVGRGKTVTIHRGAPGCRYPKKPDLEIELAEEPKDLALVKVTDLDGDGRADLSVIRPLAATDEGASAPVRLDLYLSGSVP